MRKALLPLLCAMLFFSGCVPVLSLHKFYTDKDEITDPAIIGTWEMISEKDKTLFEFKKAEGKGYILYYTGKSKVVFDAHVFQLGKNRYLDLYLGNQDEDLLKTFEPAFIMHVVPMHSVSKIELKENVIKLAFLNSDWVKKKIESKEINISNEEIQKDCYVLTAQTSELQDFIEKYIDVYGAFGGTVDLQIEMKKKN